MKTFLKFTALAAIAATAFVSCKEETFVPEQPGEVHITVKAVPQDFANETRTYIDETNTIIWGAGEYMTIGVLAGESTVFATSSDDSANEWDGQPEAYFGFSLTPGETADSYTYVGMYPASAAVDYNASTPYNNNKNAASFKVSLPATQNATAASYDPAAYIMVAKPESFESVQNEWLAIYRRATALNKVTLTNIPEDIVSVEFTAPDGIYMAGRRYIDLTTGQSGDLYGDTPTETIEVKSSLTGGSKVVWFTSWGVEIPVGSTFKIVAKSATKSYSRTLTVANKSITFKEGFLNTLQVNMANADVDVLENLAGDYLIGSMSSNKWVLMTSSNSNNYYVKADTQVTSSPEDVVYDDFTDVEDYIWTVSKVDGGYAIKSIKTGKYVNLTSDGNNANVSDSPIAFSLGIASDHKATVRSNLYSERVLQYNSGSPRFAFYKGTQSDIYMIPAVVDSRPKVETPTFNPSAGAVDLNTEVTISSETDGATIYYTTDGSTPTTSSTSGETVTITEAMTIKAIAVKDGYRNSDVATATYSITGQIPKGTAENPYTVAEARAAITAGQGTSGVYVKGIISKIVTAYNSQYKNVSFDISADGSTTGDQLRAYRAVATSANDYVVGDGVLMNGDLVDFNGTYELAEKCTVYDVVHMPTFTPATGAEFISNLSISIAATPVGASVRYTVDGSTPSSASTEYSAPISLTATTTVKAIAIKNLIQSAASSATYTKIAAVFSASLSSSESISSIEVPAGTTTATIYVSGNVDWSASASDGVTLPETHSGTGAGSFVVSFAANDSDSQTKSQTVTVVTEADVTPQSFTLTIIQKVKSSTPDPIVITAETQGIPDAYGSVNAFDDAELEGYAFKIQQVYANGQKLQWRAAGNKNGTGTMYNADAMPAGITSIVIVYNSSDTNMNHTVKIGSTVNPTSETEITPSISGKTYTFAGDGMSQYFVITNGANAGYIDSITINFD